MPAIRCHSVRLARLAAPAMLLILLLSSAAGVAQARVTKPFTPASTVDLAPGITYTQGSMRTTGDRLQSVRVATVDPDVGSVRIRALLSNDLVVRRELPSHLAIRRSTQTLRAMVATNGDMSAAQRMDAYAAPHSMHVSGGELWVAQTCTRPTLGVDAAGHARIDDVRVHITLTEVGRNFGRQVHRVNTHRDDTKTVLFTRRFASSTQTTPGGVEGVLDLEDIVRPNGTQTVTVLAMRRGAGNTALAAGKAVLSVKSDRADWVKRLRVGQRLLLQTTVVRKVDNSCGGIVDAAPGWGDVVEAMGGNHFTARGGAVAAPSRAVYPAGSQRHPRTNVGVTADGRVLMVTVDGRQPGYSVGVSLAEMGQLMISLGARNSFNLDGGGSTVMARRFLADGRFAVTNRPSDGRERLATQALTVFQESGTP
jgi:hypothetical protein